MGPKKDILSIDQFDRKSILSLFNLTEKISKKIKTKGALDLLKGKIITLLFFEPSSRTFGSFVAAIKRLGGGTIEIQNPVQFSSFAKGESFEDTIKTFEVYSDAIILRHPEVGSAAKAAWVSGVPIINAGDGQGEHPTQALLDLFTIYKKFRRLDNLKGVLAGDLLFGRTIHSLVKGLSMYKNNTLYLLSPYELRLPSDLIKSGIKFVEIKSEKDIPKDCDFWYWTRIQKERFDDLSLYEKLKNKYILTKELLENKGNKNLIIMHPLPRVNEIDPRIDSDPRAIYLTTQMKNGLYIRMALLCLVLDTKI